MLGAQYGSNTRFSFEKFKSEIKGMIKPPSKALIVGQDSDGEEPAIAVAVPVDADGNLTTPGGKILRAIPVEPLVIDREEDGEPVDPVGEALPAIPVDEAPVAIPVEDAPAAVPVVEDE